MQEMRLMSELALGLDIDLIMSTALVGGDKVVNCSFRMKVAENCTKCGGAKQPMTVFCALFYGVLSASNHSQPQLVH